MVVACGFVVDANGSDAIDAALATPIYGESTGLATAGCVVTSVLLIRRAYPS